MPRSKLLAYVQLLRLPNIFTAVADPLAGWLIAGGGRASQFALTIGASVGLYTAGIVFNDCFDYRRDCRDRPERPLPNGDIPVRVAWMLGTILFLTGLVLGGVNALPLAALIIFYNAFAKHFTWLGPATLGACRACNLALGMGGFAMHWPPVIILGAYVASLSVVARREDVRRLVKYLLLGIIVVDAALVLTITGDWTGAALVLSLLVPATMLGKIIPMT